MSKKYIAMISGGRDSTAMVEVLLKNKEPLDYIIFTDTNQEFPFMYEYLDKVDQYLWWEYNKRITFLQPKATFESWVFGIVSRGERKGMTRGLPMMTVPCFWKRESKVYNFDRFLKEEKITDYIQYIGYTYSERKRAQVTDEKQRFPLIEHKLCEADVDRILEDIDLVNPLYEHFSRTGCAMCPYQSDKSLFTLWKHYNDVWQYMRRIETHLLGMGNVVNPVWKIGDKKLEDLEKLFKSGNHAFTDVPDKACECAI